MALPEAKYKRQQKRALTRKIKSIEGEIESLKNQNNLPRVSQIVLNRNEERIEELEEELEDLKASRD